MSTEARPRILYNSHAPEAVYELLRDVAGARFEVLTLGSDDDAERRAKIAEADGAIVAAKPLTRPVIEAAQRLRVVHHQGVGYHDTIDLDALAETGAALALTPVGTTTGVAEHAVLLALAVLRRLPFADAELRRGCWHINTLRMESGGLAGRVVGYVGMGRIALAAARRFRAFETTGLYHDPAVRLPPEEERALALRAAPLDDVLAQADVLTLHLPLTDGTRHLVDARAIARMKPGAILVNTARGPLVDEAALVDALERGHLGGAGLDVFETEPPLDTPLARMRNVALTPHISAGTRDALAAKMAHVFDNLARFFDGRPMEHEVPLGGTRDAVAAGE